MERNFDDVKKIMSVSICAIPKNGNLDIRVLFIFFVIYILVKNIRFFSKLYNICLVLQVERVELVRISNQ